MAPSRSRGSISAGFTSSRPRTSMLPSPGRRRSRPSSRSRSRSARSGRSPGPDGLREVGAMPELDEGDIGRIFRAEYGRCVATLIRFFGDIDVAEDAVQEAFAVALRKWPGEGLPPNPGGWITTTARNPAIDRLRRESRGRRLLGGLTIEEVARSFLVTEAAMAQRLARAKRKIRAAHIPYRVPEDDELTDRLRPVLAVLYLVYNAGHLRTTEPDLCTEAIRLARILATLMPDEPEVAGLLALLLLTESRRASRPRPDGSLVLLGEQDRTRWERSLIEEGQAIVRRCLRRNQSGAYQLQAAINAVHADAPTIEETDWSQIVALYDQLLAVAPTPVVALNRAIAIGEVHGPGIALDLVDELDLDNYHPFHAARADLLRRLGRHD